jgi:hypothetical protein
MSGENRNMTMNLNGKDTLLSSLNSGSWTSLKTNTYTVSLKKGYNILRFYNSTGWMPDLDKIQLDLNKYNIGTQLKTITNKRITICPNPCNGFIELYSDETIKNINIYTITGSLVHTSNNKTRIDTSSLNTGLYIVETKTDSRIETDKIIKRN